MEIKTKLTLLSKNDLIQYCQLNNIQYQNSTKNKIIDNILFHQKFGGKPKKNNTKNNTNTNIIDGMVIYDKKDEPISILNPKELQNKIKANIVCSRCQNPNPDEKQCQNCKAFFK